MSKAFTKESDSAESPLAPVRPPLPPGVRNYITPAGAERLWTELSSLLARSAAAGSDSASAQRASRIRYLQEIIPSLVVAEPPALQDTIRFGARVTLQRGSATETYRLVGLDETDLDRNEISWLSPLAKALLGKRAGDRVRFRSQIGFEELAILSISYR